MSGLRISSDSDDEGCTEIEGASDAEEGNDWESTGGRLDGWGEI